MNVADAFVLAVRREPSRFGLRPAPRKLTVAARVSPYENPRGRILLEVRENRADVPVLIGQVAPFGRPVGPNPYTPAHVEEAIVTDLLPDPRGELEIGARRVFWARFIDWPKIGASRRIEQCETVLARLRQRPWAEVRPASLCPLGLEEQIQSLRRLAAVAGLDPVGEQERFLASADRVRLGFAHGDLWADDVLCGPSGRLCIVDWEWAARYEPAGLDVLDLAVSIMAIDHACQPNVAFEALASHAGGLATLFRTAIRNTWDCLDYDRAARQSSLFAWCARCLARIERQNPRGLKPGHMWAISLAANKNSAAWSALIAD